MKHLFLLTLATTGLLAAGEPAVDTCLDGHDHHHHHNHQHGNAPIGVMGDHLHPDGEWMVSYRYMFMRMDKNYDGSDSISDAEVLGSGYMVAPTDMDMEMHMLGIMYAPTDWLTLMGMVNLVDLSMNHVRSDMAVVD